MEDVDLIYLLAILALLLLFSAFFSSSETGITGASEGRMRSLAKSGDKRAEAVLNLMRMKDRLISTILVGNNLVNILASSIATALAISWFGDAGIIYATSIMSLSILIFAEILPKSYALINPDKVALFIAPMIRIIHTILWPVTVFVQILVKLIVFIFRLNLKDARRHEEFEEELRGIIDMHGTSTTLNDKGEEYIKHERKMLQSILDLDDVKNEAIMTHRKSVAMVDLESPTAASIDEILQSPYTRIPLYKKSEDNICGIIHAKALLRALRQEKGAAHKIDLLSIATPPWFVPDTSNLLDQLQAFRARREHFAVVVDEYGSFMGIITLEDILEQIVGTIEDEHDINVQGVKKNDDGTYIIDGTLNLRELNREFEWDLPDDNASTLAGLILHEARIIPTKGQIFEFHGFRFEIMARIRQQITKIKLTPPVNKEKN